MLFKKTVLDFDNLNIPALSLSNEATSLALIIHGYGGNKEEIFGLSSYLASINIDSLTIDLRGHGENTNYYTIDVLNDINKIIDRFKSKKKMIAIGHSLGGRLALISDAEIKIGISPAICKEYSDQTKTIIKNFRSYRVKENRGDINFDILSDLKTVNESIESSLIVFGSRDVPEIQKACAELKGNGISIRKIENAMHNDIYTLNETFHVIGDFITNLS